ncbi:MAG: FAD-dependent oxidoreductase [Acidobacteria bacterium]|nr:FAD-dependent oxidoreductase [Acidobacteriota bacterium]
MANPATVDTKQTAAARSGVDVLIVGAGPTGLVLALWLTRMGVRVRIVDKTAGPGTTSRAVAVQARTLEFYSQIGLADAVVQRGWKAGGVNLWVAGERKAHASFADLGAGLSPFPYALLFTQDEHERLLIDRLRDCGVTVERDTELAGFEEGDGHVRARLKGPAGVDEWCEAAYLAGCDGAHSTVRETLAIGFPGGTYDQLFYVADVEGTGPALNGEVHIDFEATDFLAVFPLNGEGRARLVGTVRDGGHDRHELSWQDVGQAVVDRMHIQVTKVTWFSTYRVHHKVADRFRTGRAFLLGDAAHVHSPVGGQGMNTGIGDAVNLAWKLAAVVRGRLHRAVLDSYEPERIAFARRLVATTDRAFTGVTSPRAIARFLRTEAAPALMPSLLAFAPMRRVLFRTVSQTAINYRGSSLSQGRAGAVHGGDRLPWVKGDGGEGDNFASLTSLDWQIHVYGEAAPALHALSHARALALHVFPWRADMASTGLRRNAVYLIRPDGYVALADAEPHADDAIAAYLDSRAATRPDA